MTLASHLKSSISSDASLFPSPPSTKSHNNNNTFNNITQQQHLQQHHGSSKASELHCAKHRHCHHLKSDTHATVTHARVYTTCICYATYRFQQPPYPSSPFVENPDNGVMFAFEIENRMEQQVTRRGGNDFSPCCRAATRSNPCPAPATAGGTRASLQLQSWPL